MASQRLAWVRSDVDELCELGRRDPTAAVPSCPGWTVADLLCHIAGWFEGWWTFTLDTEPDDEVDPAEETSGPPPAPAEPSGAAPLLAEAAAAWLAKAEAIDPAKPTWTFAGPGRADFWFGRASTECSVHLWDARGAFEPAPTIPPARAADVISETLGSLLPAVFGSADLLGFPRPTDALGIFAADTDDEWVLVPTASGAAVDDGASPDVILRGPVSDLSLFLHGRGRPGVEVSGVGDWSAWERFVELYSGATSAS